MALKQRGRTAAAAKPATAARTAPRRPQRDPTAVRKAGERQDQRRNRLNVGGDREVPAALAESKRTPATPLANVVSASLLEMFPPSARNVPVRAGAAPARAASALGTTAFTTGGEIHVDNTTSERVLAHEAAHALQQRGASAGSTTRGRDDRAEHQADAYADFAVKRSRDRRPPPLSLVRAPAIYRSPDKAAEPEKLPSEDVIRALLEKPVAAGDVEAALARVTMLSAIFSAYVAPYRERLADRLRTASRTDSLATLFHGRLATASRQRLIRALSGPAQPLVDAHPDYVAPFAAAVTTERIQIKPDAIVIDSKAHPYETIDTWIESDQAPPIESGHVTIGWAIQDIDGSELATDEADWLAESATSDHFAVQLADVADYDVVADIVFDGVLQKRVRRRFSVQPSELDKLRQLSIADLTSKAVALQRRMATGDTDNGRVQQQIANIEWVAGESGQTISYASSTQSAMVTYRNVPPYNDVPEVAVLSTGDRIADDPATVRIQLLAAIAAKSYAPSAIAELESELANRMTYIDEQARIQDEDWVKLKGADLVLARRLVKLAQDQLALIKAEEEQFKTEFTAALWETLHAALGASEQAVHAYREQYGVPRDPVPSPYGGNTFGSPAMMEQPYTAEEQQNQQKQQEALAAATQTLVKVKTEVEAEHESYLAYLNEDWWMYYTAPDVRYPDGCTAMEVYYDQYLEFWNREGAEAGLDPDYREAIKDEIAKVPALRARRAKYAAEQARYNALFTQTESQFPVLAMMRRSNAAELAALAAPSGIPIVVGQKAKEVEKNLATVRKHLDEDPSDIWQLDNLVHMTMARLHVPPDSRRAHLVESLVSDAESWVDTALVVIGVGLALLAAPFTAGSSIAIAIELATFAVDAYVIYRDVQDYQFGMAAAHSDIDPLRTLASQEPSMLGMIMDIGFSVLGVAGAIKGFNKARKLKNAIAAGKAEAAETKALVKELNELGQEAKLVDRKLGDEVVEETERALHAAPYEAELTRTLKGTPLENLRIKARPLDDAAFKAATGSDSAQAAVVFKRNPLTRELEPELLVRRGADPSVVREEVAHLRQWSDPTKRKLLEELDEAKLARWSSLSHEERLTSVRAKLELEIDAQKQVLAELRSKSVLSDAEALQMDSAWQNIENLRTKFSEWAQLDETIAKKTALSEAERLEVAESSLLAEPPRLFNKPTTTEFDALDIAAKDAEDFAAEYERLHPHTTLSTDEIKLRYKDGQRINPDSGLLHTPGRRAPRKPDVPADPKLLGKYTTVEPPAKGYQPLPKEAQPELDDLIKQRDEARQARNDAIAAGDETKAGKQMAKVNEASRQIGERRAIAYMKHHYPDFELVYPKVSGSRSGDFDLVFRKTTKTAKGEVYEHVIVEAKGGAGKLGVKEVKGKVVEQGTSDYYRAIRDNMFDIDEDVFRKLMLDDDPTYLLIQAPIESGAPSVATDLIVSQFKISL